MLMELSCMPNMSTRLEQHLGSSPHPKHDLHQITAMSNPLLGDNGHDYGAPTDATNFENIQHFNEASCLLV